MTDQSPTPNTAQQSLVPYVDQKIFASTLAQLLQLSSDAILCFDSLGKIQLASQSAADLWAPHAHIQELLGQDIRALFIQSRSQLDFPFRLEDLPFSIGAGASYQHVISARGEELPLALRAHAVGSSSYLLVANVSENALAESSEQSRLIRELKRSNNRLLGTLRIVLGTLHAEDPASLFSEVLDEISLTMEAEATLLYVARNDGFHNVAKSKDASDLNIPKFLPFNAALETELSRQKRTLRFRKQAPSQEELRAGDFIERYVDEDSQLSLVLDKPHSLPFSSFFIMPIYFGGQLLAQIIVGSTRLHPTRSEDCELLDTVSQYLSIQLVSAISQMKERHKEELADLRAQILSELTAEDSISPTHLSSALNRALCEPLDAHLLYVEDEKTLQFIADEERSLHLSPAASEELQQHMLKAETGKAGSCLVLTPSSAISKELKLELSADHVYLAVLHLAEPKHEKTHIWFVYQELDAEPFDETEQDYIQRVLLDIQHVLDGQKTKTTSGYIAQALETGMKNELQKVEGLRARALYSSATQQSSVGGDFYDLIRLPKHKACIILGDVSGKGVEAASVSAAVKTALAAYSWQGLSPRSMVSLLNDFLLGFSRLETFATLFVGIVDVQKMTLTYCSAGHPPALLLRRSKQLLESLDVQSGVVGAFKDLRYRDGQVQLLSGDALILYTDGTTEARNPSGDFFGEEGLRSCVLAAQDRDVLDLPERILNALDDFSARHLEDDVALFVCQFEGLAV